jgi:ketosteroid isomerase-like protein
VSVEFNKAIVRRYFDELLNQGQAEGSRGDSQPRDRVLRSLWDVPGSRSLAAVFPNGPQGLSGPPLHGRARHSRRRHGGELLHQLRHLLGEFHGFGAVQGAPSSGRRVSVKGVSIFQIRDSKITEVRTFYDTVDQMQQLGLIPSLNATGR